MPAASKLFDLEIFVYVDWVFLFVWLCLSNGVCFLATKKVVVTEQELETALERSKGNITSLSLAYWAYVSGFVYTELNSLVNFFAFPIWYSQKLLKITVCWSAKKCAMPYRQSCWVSLLARSLGSCSSLKLRHTILPCSILIRFKGVECVPKESRRDPASSSLTA